MFRKRARDDANNIKVLSGRNGRSGGENKPIVKREKPNLWAEKLLRSRQRLQELGQLKLQDEIELQEAMNAVEQFMDRNAAQIVAARDRQQILKASMDSLIRDLVEL